MKSIKQHLFHPKIHQIAGYSPNFWLKNALFSNFPKSHWGFWKRPIANFCINMNNPQKTTVYNLAPQRTQKPKRANVHSSAKYNNH
ncbi:hypothetical protein THERMOS_1467 [Bathymodiolus thermophilus thioautotrophic gill symbiont]|uniref:Uncharacterized protein n=1 Tax=Bathymodiolus thermophilus thioautotrophic gill symbiont TaxID=2360 RepID=A0A8H9CFY9_9GAMM|nr:hypothetical protein THERMOS_1467 [Bathymodiolus thermophilus thioautotrophic gill symbiont]